MRFLLPLALLFVFASCDKTEYKIVYVESVDAPSTANINEVTQVTVHFTTPTSAGSFDKFIESSDNMNRYIEVLGRFGPDSQPAFTPHTASYSFKGSSSGTYTLNFKSGESTYITKTITVN